MRRKPRLFCIKKKRVISEMKKAFGEV